MQHLSSHHNLCPCLPLHDALTNTMTQSGTPRGFILATRRVVFHHAYTKQNGYTGPGSCLPYPSQPCTTQRGRAGRAVPLRALVHVCTGTRQEPRGGPCCRLGCLHACQPEQHNACRSIKTGGLSDSYVHHLSCTALPAPFCSCC